jgi:hypothetical protein
MKYVKTFEAYVTYNDIRRSSSDIENELRGELIKLFIYGGISDHIDDLIYTDQSTDKGIKWQIEVKGKGSDIIHAYKVSQFRFQENQGWELYFNKKKTSFSNLKSQLEREYMSDLDRFLKYFKSYDFYADYIDDGRQWKAATANNDNLVNMFNALSSSDKKKAKKELVAHFKSAELQPRLEQTFKI